MSLYDKASIALIPSGVKSTKLYSVLPANGDGDFTHSRGSTATRINKDGLIESVASGVPRLDYPLTSGVVGDCPNLLLEPSRTNLLVRSEDLSTTWVLSAASVTTNTHVSPDGNLTADTLTVTGSGGGVYQDNITVSASTDYTFTFYAKRGTIASDELALAIRNQSAGAFIDQNIAYTATTDDWTRIERTFTTPSGCTSVRVYPQRKSGGGQGTVFLWGCQLEEASYSTSYIPTTSASVTRSVDASKDSGSASLINSEEGVLFAEIAHLTNGDDHRRITLSDGSTSNVVRISYDSTTNEITALVYNGSNQCVFQTTSHDITNLNKVALQYKANEFKCFVNGSQLGSTDTSGTTFSANTLTELAFDSGGGGNLFVGKCKQLIVFNETLTDAELTTLTTQ